MKIPNFHLLYFAYRPLVNLYNGRDEELHTHLIIALYGGLLLAIIMDRNFGTTLPLQ
jgi:hypothetical protein